MCLGTLSHIESFKFLTSAVEYINTELAVSRPFSQTRLRNDAIDDTVNNRLLSESVDDWKPPIILKDSDNQLKWLSSILDTMHTEFFRQVRESI